MKSIRSIIIRSILCFGLFFQLTIVKDLDKILQHYFPDKYIALQHINSGAESRITKQLLLAESDAPIKTDFLNIEMCSNHSTPGIIPFDK